MHSSTYTMMVHKFPSASISARKKPLQIFELFTNCAFLLSVSLLADKDRLTQSVWFYVKCYKAVDTDGWFYADVKNTDF